ncbi:MAG: DUF455 family protein [Deltaproteobacteria bacterium]|jgi:uncharacterized ferritin-like protein (DUF455 family)
MEVSAYAERILFGATLADKRVTFDRLTDDRPGAGVRRVREPGRPKALAFGRGRFEFPRNLEDDRARGRALHFFLNHELLASELMALVLLRFPEAPTKFRMGLAKTIADEQRHLGLYLDRMQALGVELGEVPVNDFFWRTLSDMEDPLDFVAAMSLGFEQANLDFSRHYQARFEQLGDDVTARLLVEVYEDEIRHVRRGVQWYAEAAGPLTFADHASRVAPMSMMRVKGPVFDAEGRRRAALPDAYVDAVRTFAGTKGRAPRAFVFNATAEEEVQHGRRYTAPEGARTLEADLGWVMAYLASPTDVVVAPTPTRAFLRSLVAAGFEVPAAVDSVPEDAAEIVPWGWSPRFEGANRGRTATRVPRTSQNADMPDSQNAVMPVSQNAVMPASHNAVLAVSQNAICDLYDKRTTVRVAHAFGDDAARVATTPDEVLAAIHSDTLVKAIYGASGRNRRRFDGAIDEAGRNWLARALRAGAVIVEPWAERWRDFGIVLHVGRKDPLLDVFELLVDPRGAYRGHRLAAPHHDFPQTLRADFYAHVRRIAEHVAAALAARGYEGPAGVDAFVTRDGRWRSIVDVNARHTMGHVARALKAHVAPKTDAVWWHVPTDEPTSLAARLREAHPLGMADGKITSGVLMTTDPERAQRTLTMLVVGAPAIEDVVGL